jgi:methylphosphotriester-DNA--protein-cysteine methyltransferase
MPGYTTPKSRWTALLTRDSLAANAFVYCVMTTKIYCRPNCPSRLARRANIEFHDNATDAQAAGYRACMRCKPEISEEAGDPQKIAIAKTCATIAAEAQGGQKKGVRELAKDAGFTESHFCRIFKKGTGMTVGEYRASVASKRNVAGEIPASDAQILGNDQNIVTSEVPYEFDFNAISFLDGQDQAQLDLELASGWFDFSRTPDMHDSYGMDMYEGLFDEGYLNSATESSLETTPRLWPLATNMDEDLQMLGHEQQFSFVT